MSKGLACIVVLATTLLAQYASAQKSTDNIEFTGQINGWRNTSLEKSDYTQPVNYPAVRVETPEGQGVSATIAGRIKNTPKPKGGGATAEASSGRDGSSVGTLIVNGVPLPQRIESDGTFSRPYAFGSGANNLEMRTSDGSSKRVQFYDSYTTRINPRLRIILSWDTDGTDVDLHVVSPDGQETWYGNRVAGNGGALDVDVTTGYGPEIYSNPTPVPGNYLVYVNYFGSGAQDDDLTTATITIITEENTPSERKQTFMMPLTVGELNLVKSFVVK